MLLHLNILRPVFQKIPLILTCCLLAPVSAQPELTHLVMAEPPGLAWSRGPRLDHGGEQSSSEPPGPAVVT